MISLNKQKYLVFVPFIYILVSFTLMIWWFSKRKLEYIFVFASRMFFAFVIAFILMILFGKYINVNSQLFKYIFIYLMSINISFWVYIAQVALKKKYGSELIYW